MDNGHVSVQYKCISSGEVVTTTYKLNGPYVYNVITDKKVFCKLLSTGKTLLCRGELIETIREEYKRMRVSEKGINNDT